MINGHQRPTATALLDDPVFHIAMITEPPFPLLSAETVAARATVRDQTVTGPTGGAAAGYRPLASLVCGDGVYRVAALPNSRIVATCSDDPDNGTVSVWDVDSGACIHKLRGHEQRVTCLSFLPSPLQYLVTASSDATIRFWDCGSGSCTKETPVPSVVMSFAILYDGRLACGREDGDIFLWSLRGGSSNQPNGSLSRRHRSAVLSLAVLSDGRLASGSSDGTIDVWDVNTGSCTRTLSGHSGAVYCLVSLPDGRLASGCADSTVCVWDLGVNSMPLVVWRGHKGCSTSPFSTTAAWQVRLSTTHCVYGGQSRPRYSQGIVPACTAWLSSQTDAS